MKDRTRSFNITLPPVLDNITDAEFRHFLLWDKAVQRLKKELVDPFMAAAKAASKYSANNVPEKPDTEELLNKNGIRVLVHSHEQVPPVDWPSVVDEFGNFIEQLRAQYADGVSREGVFTVETPAPANPEARKREPYVETGTLAARYELLTNTLLRDRSPLNQAIDIEGAVEPSESLVITSNGRNYRLVNEQNARDVLRAKAMIEQGKRRTDEDEVVLGNEKTKIPRFKKLLLKHALEQIGGRPEYKAWLNYCEGRFDVGLKARSVGSYAKIMPKLFKPRGDKIKTNSAIGDIVLAELFLNPETSEVVVSKGLVDKEFTDTYNPVFSGRDLPGVRLDGVIARLAQYKGECKDPFEEVTIEASLDYFLREVK